jgi:hypothetical protein
VCFSVCVCACVCKRVLVDSYANPRHTCRRRNNGRRWYMERRTNKQKSWLLHFWYSRILSRTTIRSIVRSFGRRRPYQLLAGILRIWTGGIQDPKPQTPNPNSNPRALNLLESDRCRRAPPAAVRGLRPPPQTAIAHSHSKQARRNSGGICLLVHNGQAQPCAHASTAHGGGEREEAKSFEMFAIMAGRDGQAGSAEGQRRALASLESA